MSTGSFAKDTGLIPLQGCEFSDKQNSAGA